VFDIIEVDLDTVAGKDILATFEYWSGAAWTQFYPVDNTEGFQENGSINFSSSGLSGWATTQVNGEGDGPWYYVRITRTRTGSIITSPIEDTIQVDAVTNHWWNKDGQIFVNDIKLPDAAFVTAGIAQDTYFLVSDASGNTFKVGCEAV
jgi:hypothetical protein